MQVCIFLLKLGFHWTFLGDCTVGTSLGGTTREILGGFPDRVMSSLLRGLSMRMFLDNFYIYKLYL